MSDQELFLNLSSGPVSAEQIAALHLRTFDVLRRCTSVALWLKGAAEPRYFPRYRDEGLALIAWANALARHDAFLAVSPWHLFAIDAIVRTDLGWDGDIPVLRVHMSGETPLFAFPREGRAADAIRCLCWKKKTATDDEATAPRTAVALAS